MLSAVDVLVLLCSFRLCGMSVFVSYVWNCWCVLFGLCFPTCVGLFVCVFCLQCFVDTVMCSFDVCFVAVLFVCVRNVFVLLLLLVFGFVCFVLFFRFMFVCVRCVCVVCLCLLLLFWFCWFAFVLFLSRCMCFVCLCSSLFCDVLLMI